MKNKFPELKIFDFQTIEEKLNNLYSVLRWGKEEHKDPVVIESLLDTTKAELQRLRVLFDRCVAMHKKLPPPDDILRLKAEIKQLKNELIKKTNDKFN